MLSKYNILLIVLIGKINCQLPYKYDLTWFENHENYIRQSSVDASAAVYKSDFKEDINDNDDDSDNKSDEIDDGRLLMEFTNACKQTPACVLLGDQHKIETINCVRKCVSPGCYTEIYSANPIEEGEIDLRFPRFKRCFYDKKKKNISL